METILKSLIGYQQFIFFFSRRRGMARVSNSKMLEKRFIFTLIVTQIQEYAFITVKL